MVPRGAEEAQNGTRSGPKPPQEEPKKVKKANLKRQDEKRTELRRSQDRLGPAKGAIRPFLPHPQGVIWEAKSAPGRSKTVLGSS